MERFPMNVEAIVYAARPTSFSFASDAVVIARIGSSRLIVDLHDRVGDSLIISR
jgi:hypothetical protein